ncbi:MAG: 2Fe-2S iron-sulfur cluster-binding protein [Gammaproteobacteria bacterium]
MKRLPPVEGEGIDRAAPLEFSFEGRRLTGFKGDTICSALAAHGVTVVGRSFKYHRPRGLFSVANHDVNAMFQVEQRGRSIPNVRGDVAPLRAGMKVAAVNTAGGLETDRMAGMERLARFLPVGFYYKAFHGRWFPKWERLIRRAAGLGVVDKANRAFTTPKRYAHTDVLVIGGGPSGLAAAHEAAERGAGVILADEWGELGGSALYARGGASVDESVRRLADIVIAHRGVRVLSSTFAAGYYADHWVSLVGPENLTKVRARAVVVAQGAIEQPAVFRGNDLPGVMLASGAQRLLSRYAVAPASRVVIITANAEGYAAALDAFHHGITVAGVLDLRERSHPSESGLTGAIRDRGIVVFHGVKPVEARADSEGHVRELEFDVEVSKDRSARHYLAADGVWMSVGFAPANALLQQAGAKMRYETAIEQFVPSQLPAGVFACGRVAGAYELSDRVAQGREAGRLAAAHAARSVGAMPETEGAETLRKLQSLVFTPRGSPSHPFPVFPHPKGQEFIDLDEDLHLSDLINAFQEGFDSSELLKRYSTVGMGPSQGKHSNLNAMRVLAKLREESVEAVGPTTARPMFHPVSLAHLAGRGFHPHRRTSLHDEHEKLGAVWMPAGDWQRPEYYARSGETRMAGIEAEVRAVRTGVGLIDVGTLGKIEAHGPIAGEFLGRVYTGQFGALKVGATRYGLALDEAGVIVDDGVIARLGKERFYFTTTTGNSGSLFRELGRLATMWRMPVGLVNLTGHFAAFNLAGPLSRAVLSQLTHVDLSHAAFPYLGVREAEVAGVRCRLMRVGFVGEMGYEIHLPAVDAIHVWSAVMRAGERFGIRAFGVEAQRVLRLEKGHVIVGQDTDGLTTPLEIGAEWALRMNKPFFIGQRSLQALQRLPQRQRLVGFTLPAGSVRPKECHLVIESGRIAGRVTSIQHSPTLGHAIGLAFVEPPIAQRGSFRIRVERGEEVSATVASLPFYDAPGERQTLDEDLAERTEMLA